MTPITWYLYGRSGGAKKAVEEIGVKGSMSGDIASFSDGADDVAVKSLVAEITPVQSGSGDPSPTNIRPISGRTGMTVAAAGKNLCSGLHQGIINADGSYTAAASSVTNAISAEYGTPVKAGTYTISSPNLNFCTALTKNANGTVVQSWAGTWNALPFTFTVNAYSMLFFSCRKSDNSNIDPTAVFAQLESGSTATVSAPYAATYPITWQTEVGTVYGGTLDVVSGVLTVDRAMIAVKNMAWSRTTSYAHPVFYVNQNGKALTYQKGACSFLRDIGRANIVSAQNFADYAENGDFALCSNNTQIFVRYDDVTDVSTFKTQFEDETFVYPLATPQTYQITPTEVRTLLGGNTIYTDAGDVSVEYIADTKLYIDNKIAELQALVLEN